MFLGFRISPRLFFWSMFGVLLGGWSAGFSLGYTDRGCGERHAAAPPSWPVPPVPMPFYHPVPTHIPQPVPR
jgi:hypothetical protein